MGKLPISSKWLHAGIAVAGIGVIVMLMMSPPARSAAAASDITGVWITDDGQGAVRIEACGDMRCGRIVWLKTPLDAKGRPLHDANNPNPAERQRPICGIQIVDGLKLQRDGSWDAGRIYDPEDGKSYDAMMKASGARLEVTGYLGLKMLGETVVWTRQTAQFTPCR
jgi:uncharacterized protein (DUF2147 family)